MRGERIPVKRCPRCKADTAMLNIEKVPAGFAAGIMGGGTHFLNYGGAGIDLRCLRCGWRRVNIKDKAFMPAQTARAGQEA